MGLTIKTDDKGVKVFRKDREGKNGPWATYSVGVSSKDMNGNWINGYVDVQFKKGVEVNNKATIVINNAFPVVNESNGRTFVKYMITDFTVLEEGQPQPVANNDGFVNIPEGADDLPFAMPSR